MVIFSHIEHILHNHFATFRSGLGFLKLLTLLADGILGLIIGLTKGEISSN
jgi:hypothetical protein